MMPGLKYITLNDYENNQVKACLDCPNKRLKIITHQVKDPYLLHAKIHDLAVREGFGKLLWLLRPQDAPPLLEAGYIIEGRFANYFRGQPALWLSYFLESERRSNPYLAEEEAILWRIEKKGLRKKAPELAPRLHLKIINPGDAPGLAQLYADTFVTYPTPVTEAEYLCRTMAEDTIYLGVYDGNYLVSAASGVIDKDNLAAEISDCATRPEYRGQGLMSILIAALETKLTKRGVVALYSLARATSAGMNSALYNSGFTFRGRFTNNCHICGRFEDMNLWTRG